jgi:hypothetical protein
MAMESANPDVANPGEWLERIVLPNGVWVHGVRYYSDELMKLKQGRRSLRGAVRLEKPDASAILVRVPRRKSILSVPAVSSAIVLRSSEENS